MLERIYFCHSSLCLNSKCSSVHDQMDRGRFKGGSLVMIRCLKQKRKSHSSQKFNCHIELISNLRYCHLAGARGHCFEYYLDDSTISRFFFFFFLSLIFEFVSSGMLRRNIARKWFALPTKPTFNLGRSIWHCALYLRPSSSTDISIVSYE